MKNEHSKGGMKKITDVERLNRSLKIKQFFRSSVSKHAIANIKLNIMNGNLVQEYSKVTNYESVCQSTMETMNIITDYNRSQYKKDSDELNVIDDSQDNHKIKKCL